MLTRCKNCEWKFWQSDNVSIYYSTGAIFETMLNCSGVMWGGGYDTFPQGLVTQYMPLFRYITLKYVSVDTLHTRQTYSVIGMDRALEAFH